MTRLTALARPRVLALAIALGLSVTLLPADPSSAATKRVTSRNFGMTDGNPVTWPEARVGAVRLWDSGVTWRQIETSPGVFDFTQLDAQVDAARANGADVLLVLGQTPRFHATKPNARGALGPGSTSMPNLTPWRNYVGQVVRRYKGRGVDYQVWNEANVSNYWTGTVRQMATLTKVAAKAVSANDASADVISPALATRLTSQRRWLRDFYALRTGGRPVANWVDVVSLHLYPLSQQGPEASAKLLTASRTMLGALDVRKPIWNTEINYGLEGGEPATPALPERQQANVATTYLLNAADGVERVYWYSWDLHTIADTDLVEADNTTLTPAGRSFGVAQRWMLGTKVESCDASQSGTWTCVLQAPEGVRRVYWNSGGTSAVRTAFDATSAEVLGQLAGELPPGGTVLQVGEVPVLVTSDDSGSSSLPPRL